MHTCALCVCPCVVPVSMVVCSVPLCRCQVKKCVHVSSSGTHGLAACCHVAAQRPHTCCFWCFTPLPHTVPHRCSTAGAQTQLCFYGKAPCRPRTCVERGGGVNGRPPHSLDCAGRQWHVWGRACLLLCTYPISLSTGYQDNQAKASALLPAVVSGGALLKHPVLRFALVVLGAEGGGGGL